ncbi:MAG: CAP domain-containing protein [Acidimicrobiia bacterium]|nr:CAP domain-containing protein [Acidimicrobiia bacterium]
MRARGKKRATVAIAAIAVALIVSACGSPAPPAAAPGCSGPGAPPDAASVAVLNATNVSRGGAGLGPLSWNGQLWCLASEWSNHLAAINSLVHRDLGATLRSAEYAGYRTLGENILRGAAGMSGDAMHAAWMGSPLHRANILSPAFSSIGFAFAFGNGQVFATENFGG